MKTLNWPMWVIVILGSASVLLTLYAMHLKVEIAGYKKAMVTYQSAQDTNLESISALEDRARSLASQDAENRAKAAEAAARNKRMFDALNEQLKNRQTVREKVYVSDKSAGNWADGVVPPAVADSLR